MTSMRGNARTTKRLFDITRVPTGVFRAKALDYLDGSLICGIASAMRLLFRSQIHASAPPGMARALSQTFVRRCVELAEASADLCHSGKWLAAIIMARALIETVAAYDHFVKGLRREVNGGDLQRIHDFIHARSFAARDDHLLKLVDDPAVKATNILTQIEALKEFRASVRDDYDYLSEYAHPNALGTFLFFGSHNSAVDIVKFQADGFEPNDWFKLVGAACSTLAAASKASYEVEQLANRISALGRASKAKPS
jgi:hypothetical protein